MMLSGISGSELREVLHYDQATGGFSWRVQRNGTKSKDKKNAGCMGKDGYLRIRVNGVLYLAHRLAWLWMTDEWPLDRIDHVNMIRSDNSWSNLRAATITQNMGNRKKYKNNTSGVKGVSHTRSSKRWMARIRIGGRMKHLGCFDTRDAAAEAYARAAKECFGDFARVD